MNEQLTATLESTPANIREVVWHQAVLSYTQEHPMAYAHVAADAHLAEFDARFPQHKAAADEAKLRRAISRLPG